MKQTTFYILISLFLTSISSFSQEEFERKNLNEKYSWNNSSHDERIEYYFGLTPVSSSNYEYHLRYEKSSQIIDLYSENGIDFKGKIINYIQENKEVKTDYGKESRANNYVFELSELPIIEASKTGRMIIKEQLYSIPTDSLITNWNFRWLDCGAIHINYKIKSDIYRKTYTCPQNQKDSLKYAVEVKSLMDALSKNLNLKKSYDTFQDKLPKGKSYTIDGWIIMYKLTDREIAYRKETEPIRDYQKSIKDTIDNYLEFKLNRLIPNSTDLNCFDEYSLVFSKNGRLKTMKVNMEFWERMFDEDYQKCRRILKKAFKEIRIDFVDPKYVFYRDLNFGQKKIYITDPTIY